MFTSMNIFLQYQKLPASELKYHLYILLKAAQDNNQSYTSALKSALERFIKTLNQINELSPEDPKALNLLMTLNQQIIELKEIANTHGFSAQLKNGLCLVIGTVNAILIGTIGALVGFMGGLIYGISNGKPLAGMLSGWFLGMMTGGMLGFRLPKKLFKDSLQRQLTFGLNGLAEATEHLQNEVLSLTHYHDEVTQEVRALFATQEEFQQFLQNDIQYKVNTFLASFIGQPILHGCAGQHAYITLLIQEKEYLIEFAPDATDTSETPSQYETRQVKGAKLIEMLALHRKLLETNAPSLENIFFKMKPGDNDCFSYINKILLGTNQQGTQLRRFDKLKMKFFGQMLGQSIEFLSPFEEDFFRTSL
ncbi:MAG: hypothetical protein EPN84_02375 [Legionella sp.]|nr:MAG: hypothetical protein EPN84_02375 [Legionella sp.]